MLDEPSLTERHSWCVSEIIRLKNSMAPKVLDQQALQAREQQIIDAAIAIIQYQGIENLTIDKVVTKVPFSKGTVYKHFLGKEDLLLAISNHAMAILSDLFMRAATYQGCTRERMLLLNFSYLIYAILHPSLFQTALCTKAPTVYEKCSQQRLTQQDQLETQLMGAIYSIVEEAIAKSNLVLPAFMDIQQICFASWSMAFGTITLLSNKVEQCGSRDNLVVERELFNQNNLFFDGLNWQPLSKDKDYRVELKKSLEQVFSSELALMREKEREFNF
jgi:AcrR family transcriptional regulator